MPWCLILLLSFIFYIPQSYSQYLCNETFCKTYLTKNNCLPLPNACLVQNSTHNGVFLKYPGPCNCCEYCLQNLAKEAVCAKGDPTSPLPTTLCGPLLSCQLTNARSTCELMSTPCIEKQKKYDMARKDGTLGHLQLRPVCDRNGFYAPFACVPGELCYCVSKNGRRLFGDIPYNTRAEFLLTCKCSRSHDDAVQNSYGAIYTNDFLRCQPQGNFDPLQCIGNSCLCTDTNDGRPAYPNMDLINITNISKGTLPCFDSKIHTNGAYYRKCELEYSKQIQKIRKYEKDGFDVFGYSLPNCQLDGNYAPVQLKNNTKYCSAPSGEKLENFEVPILDKSSTSMNCNCARARSIITSEEKPECCKNGNYKKMQCRRGLCRCVNENGEQIEKEVEYLKKEILTCFNNICD